MPITSDHTRITSIRDLRYLAGERVSGSSLRFFRVAFGCVVALSAVRLLRRGWIASLYSDPIFRFSYSGMGWVPVLPTPLMKVQVALIAVAAIAVVFNLRYRIAITILWFLFTWMEFTEATVYLNHYWFITVMSFLMIFLPLNSRGSVPRGAVWMVRFQVGLVYCFAGIAKLNTDWLVHGLPMALWLPGRSNFPVIGWVFEYQQVAIALSWAGAIFDCTIVAFLLWKRTRFVAWLAVVAFHVATYLLFPSIGVFPLLMVAASLVFFEPDWIERGSPNGLGPRLDVAAEWLGLTDSYFDYAALDLEAADPVPDQPSANGVVFPVDQSSVPLADGWPSGPPIAGADNREPAVGPVAEPEPDLEQEPEPEPARPVSKLAMAAAIVWICIQIAVPLRHLVIPGDSRWTGEGFKFSWNVLAVERVGALVFRVTDTTTGQTHTLDVDAVLSLQQARIVPTEPELIRQLAHQVAELEARQRRVDRDNIEVRVDSFVSVNGRRAKRLIDPDVDLAAQPASLWHQKWILPGP